MVWGFEFRIGGLLDERESRRSHFSFTDCMRIKICVDRHFARIVFMYVFLKYLITAAVVVLVSEVAKRSDRAGAVVASLPLVTVLSLIWLYVEHQPEQKIANHALYTFWYVLPTLPMFLIFPWVLPRFGFWISLIGCALVTAIFFLVFSLFLKRFGIALL